MNFLIKKENIKINGQTVTKVIAFSLIFSRSFSVETTLEDVLKKVKENNREIKVQNLIVKEREYEVKKSFKEFLPTVELEANQEFIKDEDGSEKNEWTNDGDKYERLNVNIPIFTGWRNTNNYKKSVLAKDISEQENNLVGYDVEERAIFYYFEILNNRTQAEISQRVIENLKDQEKRLKELYENGQMVPKSELLKVDADIVAEEAVKERRVQEQRSAEEALYLLMGINLDSNYTFADYNLVKNGLESYDLQRDTEVALTEGSQAKIEELRLKDADLDVKLARADLLPEVFGTYEYRISDDDDDTFSDYQVALTARWEIFSWGSTLDDINQKKVVKEQAELNYSNRMDEISLELRNNYRELLTLYKEVHSQQVRLELLKENLEIDSLRYLNGLIEAIDYLSSVSDLSETAATYFSLQREFLLRKREYENLLK
ncbi:transporter [Propionigenium maris DSM 9537]|uniref:Transporter n=1 Tax=Propionigenium maris DSM 9537 TaxID=1123000 RepID=A0A9W6GL79_9FUSO|nr:transporter [Propionigenium maris DSM 9537]